MHTIRAKNALSRASVRILLVAVTLALLVLASARMTRADIAHASPSFGVTSGPLFIKNNDPLAKEARNIFKNTGPAAVITKITISWPASNGNLKAIDLGGSHLMVPGTYSPPGPLVFTTFLGTAADRTVRSGAKNLQMKWHWQTGSALTGYSITFEFDGDPTHVVTLTL